MHVRFPSFHCALILALMVTLSSSCGDDDRCTCPETSGVIRVRPDGTGDFPTIQAAIDAADSLDTIELDDGIYSGSGNRDISYRGKLITVKSRSDAPDRCVIDCDGTEDEPHRGFVFDSGEGPGAVLQGVTIAGGVTVHWRGLPIGGAIYCWLRSSPTIRNCILRGNWARSGGAIASTGESSPFIVNCTFVANSAALGSAVFSQAWSSPRLQNCIIAYGSEGAAIDCRSGSFVGLSSCCVFGNEGGNLVGCIEEQGELLQNFSADPGFCNWEAGDLHLNARSPCSPDSNFFGLIGALPVGCR